MSTQSFNVAIAQISRGTVSLRHLGCLRELSIALDNCPRVARLTAAITQSGENIDKARSRATSELYAQGADVLLWVDDDILFDPPQIVALVVEAYDRQAVVGAVSAKKRPGAGLGVQFSGPARTIQFLQGGGLEPAHAIGTSLIAVPRQALRLVSEKLTSECGEVLDDDGTQICPYFLPRIEQGQWLQEDYAFSSRIRQSSVPIFADTRVWLRHLGTYEYTLEDAQAASEVPHSVAVHFQGQDAGVPLTGLAAPWPDPQTDKQ